MLMLQKLEKDLEKANKIHLNYSRNTAGTSSFDFQNKHKHG